MDTILTIISAVLGCSSLVGFLLYGKATRRLKDAEADKAQAEAEKAKAEAEKAEAEAKDAEVDRLAEQLNHQQPTITSLIDLSNSLAERLSKLNATVDKYIDRNRELSDRLYRSETELNKANERITELTEALGDERLRRKHYQTWRCERNDCRDPRGPKPPRTELAGVVYSEPAARGTKPAMGNEKAV